VTREDRGEWWVVGQLVLLAALALAPALSQWTDARIPSRIAGALLVAAGVALAAKAVRDLGPSLSPFPRPHRTAALVTTGVYALSRHPIYGGLIIASAGWALWRMSGLHLMLAAVLATYLHAKSRHEETLLLRRFSEYAAYRARTKRLVPWVF
jgi:protein-S-isoprenylcysteine O-methyltransferase Ste14